MVEMMKTMVTFFKTSHACSQCPHPPAGCHWPTPPPESPGHSQLSLGQSLVSHCSFLLGPGAPKVLFVPSKSLLSQSCVSSGGSVVGLMVTSSKRTYAMPRVCCIQSPCPCSSPLLTWTSAGDTQTQFCLNLCGVSGSWGLFEHLWQVWGLILNAISPLLPSCCRAAQKGHSGFSVSCKGKTQMNFLANPII